MHFLLPMPMLSFLNFINNNKERAEPSGSCTVGSTSAWFLMVSFSLIFSLRAVHRGDGVKDSHDELTISQQLPPKGILKRSPPGYGSTGAVTVIAQVGWKKPP